MSPGKPIVFISALLLIYCIATGQEKKVVFTDGTEMYYTAIDTTVNQMHRMQLNLGTELSFTYFRPDKDLVISAEYDYLYERAGIDAFYIFSSESGVKRLDGNASMIQAGITADNAYTIQMVAERKVLYSIHSGVYYFNTSPAIYGPSYSGSYCVPSIAIGVARFNGWGIKYLIRNPANTQRGVYTVTEQKLGSVNFDIMIYPEKPKGKDSRITYNTLGERFYFKGFYPFTARHDFGMFGLAGLENGIIHNNLHPFWGIGLHAGWQ